MTKWSVFVVNFVPRETHSSVISSGERVPADSASLK